MSHSNKNNNISILINEDIESPAGYKVYEVEDLENIKEESCDNIYIGDLLDYYNVNNLPNLVDSIIAKIKTDGKLLIKAPDLLQLSWYTCKLNLDLNKLRYILYETNRKACYTLDEIIDALNHIDTVTVDTANLTNGYEYSIVVCKNEKTKTTD